MRMLVLQSSSNNSTISKNTKQWYTWHSYSIETPREPTHGSENYLVSVSSCGVALRTSEFTYSITGFDKYKCVDRKEQKKHVGECWTMHQEVSIVRFRCGFGTRNLENYFCLFPAEFSNFIALTNVFPCRRLLVDTFEEG